MTLAVDFVPPAGELSPDDDPIRITVTPAGIGILVSGNLSHEVLQQFDETLESLPQDEDPQVLVRILSSGLEFGVADALCQILISHRQRGRRALAVWADEPLVRRGIPLALLHRTPPGIDGTWESIVPTRASPRECSDEGERP